ncbi:trace amine-associated receptor 13c-like [Lampris incognitus]|uniref:trace amine-associated receptor 13c-like n=1 Tax=Lampris incognitus TaxID=2546036 RepID=UPI0024B5AF44|nr:trace amine-associated receptor 13c-like [Lampris incognitus]
MMETLEGVELCFPQLLNTSCRKSMRPRSEAVLFYVLLSFISLLTVTLNLLVIISISHFRQLHTPTNLILLSLAVSDFLVGLLVMPGEGAGHIGICWVLGDFMCALSYLGLFIIISASVGNMVLISIDRYVAICDPLNYTTKITQKRVQISICVSWIWSVFYNIMILSNYLMQSHKFNSCYGDCVLIINYIAGAADFLLTCVFPITVIVVLYLRVFLVVVYQARAMRSQVRTVTGWYRVSVTANKSERKAAKTLGIVIAVFLLCFCPYYYQSLSGQDTENNALSVTFVIWLLYFNSCLNPVIYVFFYPCFKKAIKLITTLQILQPGSCEANLLQTE